MKQYLYILVIVFCLIYLIISLTLNQHSVLLTIIVYFCICFILLILFFRSILIFHAEKKSKAALCANNTNGLWLAPLSRKVNWVDCIEEPGETCCFWQGETIYKTWKVHGEIWVWVQNTVKNEWPKDLEFQDNMRWWKGIAVYKSSSNV